MSDDMGLNVRLALDSQSYSKQIKDITQQMKLVQSGFNATSSSLNGFGSETDKLRGKVNSLGSQFELQNRIVSKYSEQFDKAKTRLQENIVKNEQLSTKVAATTTAYNASVAATGKTSEESKRLKAELTELNKKYELSQNTLVSNSRAMDNYSTRMNNAQTSANNLERQINETNAEIETQSSKWTKAGTAMVDAGDKMKKAGKATTAVGKNLTMGVTLPIVAAGAAAMKLGMDFDSAMSTVQATSGASTKELKTLSNQAISLGQATAFSATEAAEGMDNLASAGFSVIEITQAMPGMLSLAAAGDVEVADAADIASSALRGFGLEASASTHVADVFAKTAAVTNARTTDLGEAMTYAAPPCHALGMSIEETSAAIGIMANAGIKGSTAGTTMRTAMTNLAKPTDKAAAAMKAMGFNAFDAQGKMKPFGNVIGDLQKGLKGMTEQQKAATLTQIFGKESLSGMMVLVGQGKPKLDELTNSLKASDGASAAMAKTMQNNAKSAVEEMGGSIETAAIKLEQVAAPTITKLANTIEDLANKFSNLSPATQGTIIKVALFAAAIGPVAIGTGMLITAFGTISGLLGGVALKMGITTAATIAEGAASAAAAPGIAALGAAGVAAETGIAGAGVAGVAASTGIGALGVALGGVVVAAAPFLLAGAAVVGTGLLIKNQLDKDLVPAVDLFADTYEKTTTKVALSNGVITNTTGTTSVKIADSTKKSVGSFIKLKDDATKALQDLVVNSTILTDKTCQNMISKYSAMGESVKLAINTKFNETLKIMTDFYAKSGGKTTADEAKKLTEMKAANQKELDTVDAKTKKISTILSNASAKHRQLTSAESAYLAWASGEQTKTAVAALSKNETESKAILARMKSYSIKVAAEKAGEEIKNANKSRDSSIKAANETYTKTVAAINKTYNDGTPKGKAMADKMIAEAERQRRDSVKKATDLNNGVVKQIKAMGAGVNKALDISTGEQKKNWSALAAWYASHPIIRKVTNFVEALTGIQTSGGKSITPKATAGKSTLTIKKTPNFAIPKANQHASGTNNAPGGTSLVGELGPEILNLKKGDTITSAKDSMKLLNPKAVDQTKDYAKLGDQITTGLTKGIKDGTPTLQTGMTTMTKGIMDNFGKGITDSTKPTVKITTTLTDGVTKVFTDLSKKNVPMGTDVIKSLSTGMKNTTGVLNNTTNALSNGTKSIVNDLIKDSNPLGRNVVSSLSTGMKNNTNDLNNTSTGLATNTKKVFSNLATDTKPLGGNVTQGLSDGMKSSEKDLTAVTKDLTDKVIESFRAGFDIHSPSRKTFAQGQNVALGLMNGIKSKDLKGFADKQVGTMLASFSGGAGTSSQVSSWIMQALAFTGSPVSWFPAIQQMVMAESSGNPNAINLTD